MARLPGFAQRVVAFDVGLRFGGERQSIRRLAVNRLAEKGQWDLDALKIEFEELILLDAPIEITGFSPVGSPGTELEFAL